MKGKFALSFSDWMSASGGSFSSSQRSLLLLLVLCPETGFCLITASTSGEADVSTLITFPFREGNFFWMATRGASRHLPTCLHIESELTCSSTSTIYCYLYVDEQRTCNCEKPVLLNLFWLKADI